MVESFNYVQPVRVVFKEGAAGALAPFLKEYGFCRPFFVTSKSFLTGGALDGVMRGAGARGGEENIFSRVTPNPRLDETDACAAAIAACRADCVVALGGGSVMDLAKLAAAIAGGNGEERRVKAADYLYLRRPLPEKGIPVIALPTTAGTSSEVTNISVMTDESISQKQSISHGKLYALMAVIDPLLTHSCPPPLSASAGIDALCHAVEAYWNKNAFAVTDALCVAAIKKIMRWLPLACEGNAAARRQMCEGTLLAGLGFAPVRANACHACSYILTTGYGVPHGEACAFTLDAFIRYNAGDEKTRLLAWELGHKNPETFADSVFALKKRLNLRTTLREIGVNPSDLPETAKQCMRPALLLNPVPVSEKDVIGIFNNLN